MHATMAEKNMISELKKPWYAQNAVIRITINATTIENNMIGRSIQGVKTTARRFPS
jgi:hypothetical protein